MKNNTRVVLEKQYDGSYVVTIDGNVLEKMTTTSIPKLREFGADWFLFGSFKNAISALIEYDKTCKPEDAL